MLVAMVAGTVFVMAFAGRRSEPATRTVAPPVHGERPWLAPEMAARIVGAGGTLGPLFADVRLGGPAPSPATRARIEQFAREQHVEIDLDVAHDELVAVRFAATYSGCCGYEGADTLALRLERPSTGSCCVCGENRWIDDWKVATGDGLEVTARVRVNRVEVRWRRMLALPELLERAEAMIGQPASDVGEAAGGDWIEVDANQYLRAIPYAHRSSLPYVAARRDEPGVQVVAEARTIVEVSFTVPDPGDDAVTAALRARWRAPRIRESTWQWARSGHRITAERYPSETQITIRGRRGRR